jgi:hypothetical protein
VSRQNVAVRNNDDDEVPRQPVPPLPTSPARSRHIVRWLVLAAAVFTPPATLAHMLRGDDAPPTLVTGLWLAKLFVALAVGALAVVQSQYPPAAATGAAAPRSAAWGPSWALPALLLVAFALRLPGLGEGLWFDEIQTQLEYVRLPWGALLTTFDSTNQHLLFSIAARLMQDIGGESATTLRLPAVIFGVASLWASFAFARRWLTPREAWWATVLLALSYHHVWFSQNARGYTGQLLGTLWSSALFLDLVRARTAGGTRDASTMVRYAMAVTVMLLSHVTGLVVVATHGLVWLWQARTLPAGRERWAPFAALVLAGLFTGACYASIVPQVLTAVGGSGVSSVPIEWQNPMWFVAEALRALTSGLPGGIVIVAGALLIGAFGMLLAWQRDRVATVLMLLPLLLMMAIVLSTGHNIWPRFFFFEAAFLVQLAVFGGFRVLALSTRVLSSLARIFGTDGVRVGDAVLLLASIGFLVVLPRAWRPKQDYGAAVAWVEAQRRPGDAVVLTDLTQYPIQQWLQRDWPAAKDAAELQALESPQGRTWVLYTFPVRFTATFPALWARITQRYHQVHVVPGTVGGGEIVIVERSPAP